MSIDIYHSTLTALANLLADITDLPTATFLVANERLSLLTVSKVRNDFDQLDFQNLSLKGGEFDEYMTGNGKIFSLPNTKSINSELMKCVELLGFEKAAILPIQNGSRVHGLVVVGSHEGQLNEEDITPLLHLNQLVSTIFRQAAMI